MISVDVILFKVSSIEVNCVLERYRNRMKRL